MDFTHDGGGRLGGLAGRVAFHWWGEPPSWDEMVAIDPRLVEAEEQAKLAGRFGGDLKGVRSSLDGLVGWHSKNRGHPVLGGATAWNAAFSHLEEVVERHRPRRRRRRRTPV